jgi:hypothetical protein
MILIRYLLVGLIIYLIARAFMKNAEETRIREGKDRTGSKPKKRVSREIGEYVDYEEIKKIKKGD